MAKNKNKKKILADTIHRKKEQSLAKKLMNPFEIHINKQKFSVLGQKSKNDRGVPGISRAKAIAKRKDTLLKEFQSKNKSNRFNDKRIGEKMRGMSEEDKFMARFAATRAKTHTKKSRFNLADDEELTHRGQSLAEIEKFETNKSDESDSDDQDDQSKGNLSKDFVGSAHFGGGILKRTGKDGEKTHKDLINELIAESKKRKAEKQKSKEATLELTEKLDTEWKDLLPLVNKTKTQDGEASDKPKIDDYDKVMRELRFEARGTVSDRLKTEDEIAKEEKEKLEKLEKERIERMRGFVDDRATKANHRSADDLDDDMVYESDPEYMLSYNKDGEANVEVDAEINGKKINEESDDKEEAEESDGEEESEDDLSDLKEESSESEEDDEETTVIDSETVEPTEIKADLMKRKEVMERAREELPYTFAMPNSYEELHKLLENRSIEQQSVIIERMIKCNHPSLGESNKDNLGVLFAYLMQFLNDCACDASSGVAIVKCFRTLEALMPLIFDLTQLNLENTLNSLKEVIGDKHNDFKKRPKECLALENLVFFKLVGMLCSTSDFKHHIVTPTVIFIEQLLNKSKFKGNRNKKRIAYGLFLVTLILDYTSFSKRFLPAAINFLGGVVHMAIPKTGVKLIKVLPPFKSNSTELVLTTDHSSNEIDSKMRLIDLVDDEIDDHFRIRALNTALNLIREFDNNFENLSSNVEIFATINDYLKQIPTYNYPKDAASDIQKVLQQLEDRRANKKLTYLVLAAQKPKALRLYEPKIVEIFDGKRRNYGQSKEKVEREKLLHKLKKETKGAVREIRRDKAFIGRIKIKQQIKSDRERREKVKRIYAEASVQQSELNTLDREKKKKK